MKKNDKKKLHDLTMGELNKKLAELVMAVAKARLEKKAGKLANRKQVSQMSDDIARIKTIMTQKEMES